MIIGLFAFYYNPQNNQLTCLGINVDWDFLWKAAYPTGLGFLEIMVVKITILSVVQGCECTTCGSHPLRGALCGPLPVGPGVVVCVATHHGRSDDVLLPRVGYETHHGSCLALSGHLLTEASCHAILPCGEGHMARSYDFWPMSREELRSPGQPRQWAPIKPSDDTASLAMPPPTSLISWLKSQNRPRASITQSRHSLSNSWPQKLWDNETSVAFSHAVLGVIHYGAIDN